MVHGSDDFETPEVSSSVLGSTVSWEISVSGVRDLGAETFGHHPVLRKRTTLQSLLGYNTSPKDSGL